MSQGLMLQKYVYSEDNLIFKIWLVSMFFLVYKQ